MTRVYVLDRDTLDVLGLIDQSFTALTYTRRFQAMDTVLLSINRKRLYADQIEKGRLLFLPDEGDRVFLIEQIETLQSGDQSKDLMKVTGRSLEGIAMAERLCIPPTGQSHDALDSVAAETAIKHYVDANAVDAEDPDRNVPGLVIAADAATGVIVSTAARYHVLLDFVIDIGLLSGLGWEIVLDKTAGEFVFDIITGTDRSASVFFDFDFETLEQWDELDSALDSKSVVVVAGQGEGTDREIVTRPPSGSGDPPLPSGFDRREVFIDARDIDAGETELLEARGDATLAALGDEIALEATVHQFGSFRYREHWDLGDIVLVRDVTRDLAYSARVVEVEVTIEDTAAAPTVVATLGRAFPTIRSRVSGGSGGTADGGGVSSGPPSGPAGGVLSGTYPDPGFAVDMATQAELDAVSGAAVLDGDAAGGELAGTYPNPTVASTHAGSAHHTRSHDHSSASDGDDLSPATIRLTDTTDLSLASTGHAFQVGPDAGQNMAMDDNELAARNNGAASQLNLNTDGGLVRIGANATPDGNDAALQYNGLLRASGTSFPSSPTTNDRFFRSDLGMEFQYDGTRWLCTCLHHLPIYASDGTTPWSATDGGALRAAVPPLGDCSDIWLRRITTAFYVVSGTALSGSHKWDVEFTAKRIGTNTADTLSSLAISSGSENQWRQDDAGIGALMNDGTTHVQFETNLTKTGTPGNLYIVQTLLYRMVAT